MIAALASAYDFTLDDVEARRREKRAARGGFDDRVYNAAVEAEEGAPALDYYLARPRQYPPIAL